MPVLGITHWLVECNLKVLLSREEAQQMLSRQGLASLFLLCFVEKLDLQFHFKVKYSVMPLLEKCDLYYLVLKWCQ